MLLHFSSEDVTELAYTHAEETHAVEHAKAMHCSVASEIALAEGGVDSRGYLQNKQENFRKHPAANRPFCFHEHGTDVRYGGVLLPLDDVILNCKVHRSDGGH